VPYDEATSTRRDVIVYRISGAFFFGAAATIGSVLDRIGDQHRALIVDFSQVPSSIRPPPTRSRAWSRPPTAARSPSGSPASARPTKPPSQPMMSPRRMWNVEPDIKTAQAKALAMLDEG
jgi:SulP family sulfate permease